MAGPGAQMHEEEAEKGGRQGWSSSWEPREGSTRAGLGEEVCLVSFGHWPEVLWASRWVGRCRVSRWTCQSGLYRQV